MKKYKIIKEVGGKENRIIESNIEECELESYIHKYIHLDDLVNWYERKHDIDVEYNKLTMVDLDYFIQELRDTMVERDTQFYLGDSLFLKGYEQNVRLFISVFDYGEPIPVCARPDGEHKLIILDNGVVHSDTTEKPVGTITYSVGVDDYDFGSFRFCCEVVISAAEYLSYLENEVSLADMILEKFNGKTPFDIEFAEKEKQ